MSQVQVALGLPAIADALGRIRAGSLKPKRCTQCGEVYFTSDSGVRPELLCSPRCAEACLAREINQVVRRALSRPDYAPGGVC